MNLYPRAITELFKIEVPIIQAPMLGVVTAEMIIGVAEAGGLGSLPAALLSAEEARCIFSEMRRRTSKPINVKSGLRGCLGSALDAVLCRAEPCLRPKCPQCPCSGIRECSLRTSGRNYTGGRQFSLWPSAETSSRSCAQDRREDRVVGDHRRRGGMARASRLRCHHGSVGGTDRYGISPLRGGECFSSVPTGGEGRATRADIGDKRLYRATGPRARNADRSGAWTDREECTRLSSRCGSACSTARRL